MYVKHCKPFIKDDMATHESQKNKKVLALNILCHGHNARISWGRQDQKHIFNLVHMARQFYIYIKVKKKKKGQIEMQD